MSFSNQPPSRAHLLSTPEVPSSPAVFGHSNSITTRSHLRGSERLLASAGGEEDDDIVELHEVTSPSPDLPRREWIMENDWLLPPPGGGWSQGSLDGGEWGTPAPESGWSSPELPPPWGLGVMVDVTTPAPAPRFAVRFMGYSIASTGHPMATYVDEFMVSR